MIAPTLVDTNVLAHARGSTAHGQQARARGWAAHLRLTRRGRISVQVHEGPYVTVARELKPRPRAVGACPPRISSTDGTWTGSRP
ncbi:MAG TPA: hypothetical protein VKY90_17020 [Candidatus Dormibacteraeota bacterium]|nr:hypothetical protein [Candidatus Dormibacteraeota bacterium]